LLKAEHKISWRWLCKRCMECQRQSGKLWLALWAILTWNWLNAF